MRLVRRVWTMHSWAVGCTCTLELTETTFETIWSTRRLAHIALDAPSRRWISAESMSNMNEFSYTPKEIRIDESYEQWATKFKKSMFHQHHEHISTYRLKLVYSKRSSRWAQRLAIRCSLASSLSLWSIAGRWMRLRPIESRLSWSDYRYRCSGRCSHRSNCSW